ncbi:hypothetical protein BP5796_00758 [Coleophoma crateriformis]|uniref:HNH nuclease domain-containing protein n=1 Tax=Coleophoma crateriformis TaxID=565419 RepID=A0A3D8T8Y8_9HELO|nr:hypothetical protein BP5796_00758 [Coleophoma crateriformis]
MADNKLPRALSGPPIEQAGTRKASWRFLTLAQQNHLEELGPTRRPSVVLKLSEDAGPEAYFDAKSTDLEATCEAARTELYYYKQVREEGKITHENYQEATRDLKRTIESAETELQVIKRQKKHMVQDIDEMAAPIAKVRASWISLLLDKVALAGTPLKKKNFNQSKFRDNMLRFYGAEKIIDKVKYQYCVVSGKWYPGSRPGKTQIKAAHIVPKVLSGPELNELFEVGETMLHEARNSLPLLATIEGALDDGDIAIIPHEMDGPRVLSLRLELVNEDLKNRTYIGSGPDAPRWGSLDGQVLRFLSAEEVAEAQCTLPSTTRDRLLKDGQTPEVVAANRPAQRYLYFRCVATYLTAKRKCSENPSLSPWIQRYEKGSRTMWVTPGRYARMSLLSELASIAGDIWLPEAKMIFGDDGADDRSTTKKEWDTDKVYALGLKKKLLEHEELGDGSDKDLEEEEDEEGTDLDEEDDGDDN